MAKAKKKLVDDSGLSVLAEYINKALATSGTAASDVASLQLSFLSFVTQTVQTLEEMDEVKADRDDMQAFIDSVHAGVFTGRWTAPLYTDGGETILTTDGEELLAYKLT